ncbi:hypothetical protein AHAS_Ahas11G0088700 [Arachis hypogaea]|uniref:Uncharacterized protein n=1 Tax=Arachis hypogaea TaxID=3818 RepID=A0A445APX2_ARAHY|nr:hypothetical protein Ahy_B01g052610 [Arachis hypogaea]
MKKRKILWKKWDSVLAHILKMNISHKLLRKLIRCYDAYHGCLDTLYDKIYIIPAKIRDARCINFGRDCFPEKIVYKKQSEKENEIIDSFKGATLASLTKSVIDMSAEEEENWLKFKRTFFIFIQKCFLLPTIVSTVSPIYKTPALHVDTV